MTVARERTGAAVDAGLLAWSAACLVIGAMALVLAASLNPNPTGANAASVLEVAMMPGGRWLAMAAALLVASAALLLGLPILLTLFTDRARRLGRAGVAVFAIGVLGSAGYAAMLMFVQALAVAGALRQAKLQAVLTDIGMAVALSGWVGAFYLGVLLMAVALLRARTTAAWVPSVMLVVVTCLPFVSMLGHVIQVVQVLLLAVAFTGIATSAVQGVTRE